MAPVLDVEFARSQFPALKSGFVFADNAGGSQITQSAIDRITDYLANTNVQLGADYSVSIASTQRVVNAAEEARKLFGADSKDEIIFGPSSTANLENLARGLEGSITEGDEFIITGEHEGTPFFLVQVMLLIRTDSELRVLEKACSSTRRYYQILGVDAHQPQQPLLSQSQGRRGPSLDNSQNADRSVHRMLEYPGIGCSGAGICGGYQGRGCRQRREKGRNLHRLRRIRATSPNGCQSLGHCRFFLTRFLLNN
jgi:hypothetical protein